MVRTLKIFACAAALAVSVAPASATILTLPFVGDVEHPDFDPLHIINPPPPEAPAAAPAPVKKHHHHHKKK